MTKPTLLAPNPIGMHPDLDLDLAVPAMLQDARDAGPRLYHHWDRKLFEAFVPQKVSRFQNIIKLQTNAKAVLALYIRLLMEALGQGYIYSQENPWAISSQSLLAQCFTHLIIWNMRDEFSAEEQPAAMVKAWNLCEGLQRSPLWLQRFVNARREECENISQLEDFLRSTLAPVLQEHEESEWEGPFSVTQVDTSGTDSKFLPGTMHFVAPAVLCCHNTKDDQHIGVLLRKDGNHELIGETPCMGPEYECDEPPELAFAPNQIQVNEQPVDLIFMGQSAHHAISEAGFLAISAHHSQRIWIVTTP